MKKNENIKVVEINKPNEEEAKKKILELSNFLKNVWVTKGK